MSTIPVDADARRTVRVLIGTALGVLPLKALFTDWGWLVDVWLAMAILILPAAAFRIRQRAAAWHLWPGMVLAALFLTARFLPDHAYFGLVPSYATGSDLNQLAQSLRTAMSDQAAPIHSFPAVRFYLAVGVALIAALIDVVAVCLRAPALTGIAFLISATISGAASRQAVNWVLIAAAAAGYLLVLSSTSGTDLARWGQRAPDTPHSSTLRTRASETGRSIAAIGIVLALLLASLVPMPSGNTIADQLHHSGASGNGRDKGGIFLDPLASLHGQLSRSTPINLFTVRVSRASGNEPFYLRQEVLDTYNGTAWVPGGTETNSAPVRTSDFSARPPVNTAQTALDTYTAAIHIQQAAGAPVLFYVPRSLTGGAADWSWDASNQLVLGKISRDQNYTEQVQQPAPSFAQLNASPDIVGAALQPDLQLPANTPAFVSNLVKSLVRNTNTPYARATAIFNYFADPANNFVYSLTTKQGDSGSDLVDFLTNKAGYCQQYAAAMGVMLRLAGVPARVVLGYTHPAADSQGNFQVTTNDAHAWVEAYFTGVGWVPFDPTPLTGINADRSVALPWAPKQSAQTSTGSAAPTTAAPTTSEQAPADTGGISGAIATKGSDWSQRLTIAGLAVAALLLLGLAPALLRMARRRRRLAAGRAGDPIALWSELQDTCLDLGIGWSAARTPRQVLSWLREFGLDADGVTRLETIVGSVELYSFGPEAARSAWSGAELVDNLATVRGQLVGAAGRGRRWRMRLWPLSLWTGLRSRRASTVVRLGAPQR